MTSGQRPDPAGRRIEAAIHELHSAFGSVQTTLAALVAIPGVSAKSFPPAEVRRSAEAVCETLLEYGLAGVRLLETDGHPAVYGERIVAADAPTVLVYGHHDVQPPGVLERWESPPFRLVRRDGRLYGRGAADDKGGFLAYLAAIRASSAAGALQCNVKLLIEGEEEIGSPHLRALLATHRALLGCDFIVLCDTPNFDTGVPALTYRLRGNCIVDVEVRCLERPLHSGQGGGLVPDATFILASILSRLVDADGRLAVPEIRQRVNVDPSQLAAMRALPFDSERYRRDCGLLPGVRLTVDAPTANDVTPPSWERVWAEPSLTITAIEAVPIANAANQIAHAARARLSLRTVRDLGTQETGEVLAEAIRSRAPHGAQVTAEVRGGPSWWEADPQHPLFAVARRALTGGFGAEAVMAGSGGSIGFVKPFAEIAGDRPPLLTGVQDPRSNAHSENESLHIGDWQHAMAAAVYLFDGLVRFHAPQGGAS